MMDYEAFKKEVYNLTTINLSFYKEKQMKRRIESLIKKNGFENNYDDYVKALKTDRVIYSEFINYLTINVSEFYRNPAQWEIVEKDIIPMLLEKSKNLKVWSAACSSGDEPYTLAMIMSKFMPVNNIKILATDIDREVLDKARAGVYSKKNVESLPAQYLENYFTRVGESYKIKDELKKCVEFKHHNLLKDDFPQDFDLIVCRNVLIYFTEEAKNEIYKKFNKSLKAEGILFVGSTEQIILSSKYNFRPVKTFFYVKEREI